MRRSYSRRPAPVIALALLAMPPAALLIFRPDRSPERASRAERPARSRTVHHPRPHPIVSATPTPTSIEAPELAAGRASARAFVTAYLAYLRRRGSVRAIPHAAPKLRHVLARRPVRVTPAQLQAGPRLQALSFAVQAGGSLRAVATLQDPGGPPYPLLLYLERRRTAWTVTRLGDI
jgi:hypothetical protein